MRVVCPACGALQSFESMINDKAARELIMAIAKLPSPLHVASINYIAMFRPAKSALAWSKSLRLVKELSEMVEAGYVSLQGQPDKDCPPHIWAQAMEQMRECTHLARPMKSHIYLKKIAHGLAVEFVKKEEQLKEQHSLNRDNNSTDETSMADILKEYTQSELDRLPGWYKQKHGL